MSLRVFVIFHDGLDKRNYEMLDAEEFELITFLSVNPDIEDKKVDWDFFPSEQVIREWDFPVYDKNLQKLHVCDDTMIPKSHFNETGVHWHLAVNNACKEEYIYVCHNDMFFTRGSLSRIKSLLRPGRGITIARTNFENLVNTSTYSRHELDIYTYALGELGVSDAKMYPLFTNCAMETRVFEKQMKKLHPIHKKLFMKTLAGPSYRVAITFERTWALAMGGVLDEVLVVNGILHKHPPIEEVLEETEMGKKTQYPHFQ